jgi:hypothetical protein
MRETKPTVSRKRIIKYCVPLSPPYLPLSPAIRKGATDDPSCWAVRFVTTRQEACEILDNKLKYCTKAIDE